MAITHSYDLSGVDVRPTDEQINDFINQYQNLYIHPVIYKDGNGEVSFTSIASPRKGKWIVFHNSSNIPSLKFEDGSSSNVNRYVLFSSGNVAERTGVNYQPGWESYQYTSDIGEPNNVMPLVEGDTLLVPEIGWKRYDDVHPAIKYEGNWLTGVFDGYYAGSLRQTTINGHKVKFKFKGTKVRLTTFVSSGSDFVDIRIDDTVYEQVSQKKGYISESRYNVLYFEVDGLNNEIHDFELIANGGTGWKRVDAIDIDEDGILLHSDEVGETGELNEIGQRIRCHYAATSNLVGTFSNLGEEVYIDGINDFIPPESSATPNGCFYLIHAGYEYDGRPKLVSDRNIQHSISWDELNSEGIASGSGYTYKTDLKLPLVAYFKMTDMTLNTLHDINNNFKGTCSNLTVNEKGLEFSGNNSYASFDTPVIPIGKKSIRLKIKSDTPPDGENKVILGNTQGYSHSGLRVGVFQDTGFLYLYITHGGSNSADVIITDFHTSVNVCDGEWHDILITWDGTTRENSINIYVDNFETPNVQGTPKATEVKPYTNNLEIGRRVTHNDFNFKGEISLLEIYNDVVNPLKLSVEGKEHSYTARLLTGGISADDKDNEWDEIIVNSTLNGTIEAGDADEWNIISLTGGNRYSIWTSSTSSNSASRVTRGYDNTDLERHGQSNTSSEIIGTNNYHSFRPVMSIESLTHPPQFTGDVDKIETHKEAITLTGTINHDKPIKYRVLVNGDEIIPYTSLFDPPIELNITIEYDQLQVGTNRVVIEMEDENGETGLQSFTVIQTNEEPYGEFYTCCDEITRQDVAVKGIVSNLKSGWSKLDDWEGEGEVFIKPYVKGLMK